MIRISLGNIGSGKTLCEVRNMFLDKKVKSYSNIETNMSNQVTINSNMIIQREIIEYKKKRLTGQTVAIYKNTLNIKYWKDLKKPINVVLDEAHSIINARRSMSKTNVIIMDWLALMRRVLGNVDNTGDLVLITQLSNRIDIIARDMATQVRYHICHYTKQCLKCNYIWSENSEMPEFMFHCVKCYNSKLLKSNHIIEIYFFSSMNTFEYWRMNGIKTYYKHYFVKDVEKYFNMYDTLQWDNLFSNIYI